MMAFLNRITKTHAWQCIIVYLILLYIKFVERTIRWQVVLDGDLPPSSKILFTAWHERLLMVNICWKKYRQKNTIQSETLHFLVSPSKDGTMITMLFQKFGFLPLIGSSGAGMSLSSFKNTLKALQSNKPLAITPDGSRGPRRKMKQGLEVLATKQNVPIVLVSWNTSRRFVLNSWDKMVVPKPFGRGVVMFKIIDIHQIQADDITLYLEQELTDLTHRSDIYFAHTI